MFTESIEKDGMVFDVSFKVFSGIPAVLETDLHGEVGNRAALVTDKMSVGLQMPVKPVGMVITGYFANVSHRSQQ